MLYTIGELSKISDVSTRTLRYYDEIGLLKPEKASVSGYRLYDANDVDMLQQILFYRELAFPLDDIKMLISSPGFNREQAFMNHLADLLKKRMRLDMLIDNVSKSISAMKGETVMPDKEKFEGFAEKLIEENEQKYGAEIRQKYGDQAVDASNEKVKGMSREQHNEGEKLRIAFEETLEAAFETGEPEGELAQKACDLHRQWLCIFYSAYSKAYHKSLGELYVYDERFRVNYDKIAPGCTEFLRDAINRYCEE